jgi:hypothetical protein
MLPRSDSHAEPGELGLSVEQNGRLEALARFLTHADTLLSSSVGFDDVRQPLKAFGHPDERAPWPDEVVAHYRPSIG